MKDFLLAGFLVVLGCLQMTGDLLGLDWLKGLGAATGASPIQLRALGVRGHLGKGLPALPAQRVLDLRIRAVGLGELGLETLEVDPLDATPGAPQHRAGLEKEQRRHAGPIHGDHLAALGEDGVANRGNEEQHPA